MADANEWCFIEFQQISSGGHATGKWSYAVQPAPAPDNSPPTRTHTGYDTKVLGSGTQAEMSKLMRDKDSELQGNPDCDFDYSHEDGES